MTSYLKNFKTVLLGNEYFGRQDSKARTIAKYVERHVTAAQPQPYHRLRAVTVLALEAKESLLRQDSYWNFLLQHTF